jgi:hypothetical protein
MEVSGHFNAQTVLPHWKDSPNFYFIAGWVNPRADLDALGKRKFLFMSEKEP